MLARGRPPSDVPERAAQQLAARVGADLSGDGAGAVRRSALGALLGYASGTALGALFGVARPHLPPMPLAIEGPALGLAVMAANDLPLILSGLTDPRTWGLSGWLADAVPHAVYGVATVVACDALIG